MIICILGAEYHSIFESKDFVNLVDHVDQSECKDIYRDISNIIINYDLTIFLEKMNIEKQHQKACLHAVHCLTLWALFFLILGLRIFFSKY